MPFQIFRNPVAKKRFLRFKASKSAYLSLWILALLYSLSLCAELLCNDVPLYVRFDGRSYFPVVKYYPEDAFTGSGRQTRPDYKAIRRSPLFLDHRDNFMIFPPVPYSPFESIGSDTIPLADEVTLRLSPLPRIGTVDIEADLTVRRSLFFDFFVGMPAEEIYGRKLTRYADLPQDLIEAIGRRFENRDSPYAAAEVTCRKNTACRVSLATFHSREPPPDKVRLTFMETEGEEESAQDIRFDPSIQPIPPVAGIWKRIPQSEVPVLLSLVRERFERPVEDYRVTVGGRSCVASFIKQDVRFPFPPVKGHLLGIDSAGRDVLAPASFMDCAYRSPSACCWWDAPCCWA